MACNKRNRIICIGVVVLLMIAALCLVLVLKHTKASAPENEAVIEAKLQELGVSDAVYLERHYSEVDDINVDDINYDLYQSASTGYTYYFDITTGKLDEIVNWDYLRPETEWSAKVENAPAIGEEERHRIALETVETYLSDNKVGEFTVESEDFCNVYYTLEIVERLNGEKTGTKAFVTCMPDGSIMSCLMFRASMPQANGASKVQSAQRLIGEEAALEIARAAVEQELEEENGVNGTLDSDSGSCELDAFKDNRYYLVQYTVLNYWPTVSPEEDGSRDYFVRIDAYTGDVLEVDATK